MRGTIVKVPKIVFSKNNFPRVMRLRLMTFSWIGDDWDHYLPSSKLCRFNFMMMTKSNEESLCKWLRIIIYLYGNEYKITISISVDD